MKKFTWVDAAALIIWLLPVAYIAYIYSSLPVSVPVHFGADGRPDRYGSRLEFIGGEAILMGASAFTYLLMKFLPAIDPKKYVKYGEATFQKLAFGMVVFLAALGIAIAFATQNEAFKIDKLIFPIIGLLFAFIGNMMHSIKPNYFAGIRTPWTLEDDDTWRATHRLAGKLWFTAGISLTALVLFLPAGVSTVVFLVGVGIMVLVPVGYSYMYFKKHRPQ